MKILTGLTLALCLGAASAAHAASKVTICHRSSPTKTQQLSVTASAVPEHRAHGDFIGPCTQDCRLSASVCNDSNACTNDSCNSTNGTCTHATKSCDDADACTVDTCSVSTGCAHTAADCDDDNLCTTDSCDSVNGCEHSYDVDCSDDSACTVDSCVPASGCTHTSVECDDDDVCTIDSCDDTYGCIYEPCNDDDPCTEDSCDEVTGCAYDPIVCENTGEVCDPDTGECAVPLPYCGNCAWESNGDGCENAACSAAVCAVDDFCCEQNWDDTCAAYALTICVNAATPLCSVKCGDCMAQPHGPGCEWPACEALVCDSEPQCCTEGWDEDCTHQATTSGGCEKNSATLCTPQ